MKNFIQPGDVMTVTAPYAAAAGTGILVGSLFGVAVSTVANGASAEIATRGVFNLAKTAAEAWTAGQRLYWNDTTKAVTTTASTNKLIGVAAAAAGSADTVGPVYLTASFTL